MMDRGEEEPEELFLFFEAEEKFPLEAKTSSVHCPGTDEDGGLC